jgi:hypothetical protein
MKLTRRREKREVSQHKHVKGLLGFLLCGIIAVSMPCPSREAGSEDQPVDRALVLRQLQESDLKLPSKVSELLASILPDTVAKSVVDFRSPLSVGHAVRCIPVRNSGDTLKVQPDSALFCACTGQWKTSYYTVLAAPEGEWRVLWDTVLISALPGPIADTIRLGIESGGWPTLTATGIMSAKGARQLIVIQWDGRVGHVVSPMSGDIALAGDFIELTDLDGDGIKEFVAWVREDARGHQHTEQVFRFDGIRKGFVHVPGLKSGQPAPYQRRR